MTGMRVRARSDTHLLEATGRRAQVGGVIGDQLAKRRAIEYQATRMIRLGWIDQLFHALANQRKEHSLDRERAPAMAGHGMGACQAFTALPCPDENQLLPAYVHAIQPVGLARKRCLRVEIRGVIHDHFSVQTRRRRAMKYKPAIEAPNQSVQRYANRDASEFQVTRTRSGSVFRAVQTFDRRSFNFPRPGSIPFP